MINTAKNMNGNKREVKYLPLDVARFWADRTMSFLNEGWSKPFDFVKFSLFVTKVLAIVLLLAFMVYLLISGMSALPAFGAAAIVSLILVAPWVAIFTAIDFFIAQSKPKSHPLSELVTELPFLSDRYQSVVFPVPLPPAISLTAA